jgi:hypothetical protein
LRVSKPQLALESWNGCHLATATTNAAAFPAPASNPVHRHPEARRGAGGVEEVFVNEIGRRVFLRRILGQAQNIPAQRLELGGDAIDPDDQCFVSKVQYSSCSCAARMRSNSRRIGV